MRCRVSDTHVLVMATLLHAAFAVLPSGTEQAQASDVYQPAPATLLTATSDFSATMNVAPA